MSKRPFSSTVIFTGVGRFLGLLIPVFIAALYGVSPETDAFFFVYGILFYFIGIFSHIFEVSVIPYLAERKKKKEPLLGLVLLILCVLTPVLLGACGMVWFVLKLTLINVVENRPVFISLTPQLFLEFIPFLVLSLFISAMSGILYVNGKFWLATSSPLIRSIVVLVFIGFKSQSEGIHALSQGFVTGETFRFLVILLFMLFAVPGILKLSWAWTQEIKSFLNFFKDGLWQLIALIAVNLIVLTDHWFATALGGGQLSLLNYADRLLQIPYLIFGSSFLHIFLSDWSRQYQDDSKESFWNKITKDIRITAIFSLVLGLSMFLFRKYIIQIFYWKTEFDIMEQALVTEVFGYLALALIPALVFLLYGRVLFILKESKFYCFFSWGMLLVNIVLNALFSKWYGLSGIALATLVVYAFTAVGFYLYLRNYKRKVLYGSH